MAQYLDINTILEFSQIGEALQKQQDKYLKLFPAGKNKIKAKQLKNELDNLLYPKNAEGEEKASEIIKAAEHKMTEQFGEKLGNLGTASGNHDYRVTNKYQISANDSIAEIAELLNSLFDNLTDAQLNKYLARINNIKLEVDAEIKRIQAITEGGLSGDKKVNNYLVYKINKLLQNIFYGNIYLQSGQFFEYLVTEVEKQKVLDSWAENQIDEVVVANTGSKKTGQLKNFYFGGQWQGKDVSGQYSFKDSKITTKVDISTASYNLSLKNLSSLSKKTRLQGDYLNKNSGTLLRQFLSNELIEDDFASAYLKQLCETEQGVNIEYNHRLILKQALFIIALTGYGQGQEKVDYLVVNDQASRRIVVAPVGQIINKTINNYKMISVPTGIFKGVHYDFNELNSILDLHVPVAITRLDKAILT